MVVSIRTITSLFMVPTLGLPKGALKYNGFKEAYIEDSHRDEQYKDAIYLLFKPKDMDEFSIFLQNEYDRTNTLIDDYDLDKGHVVLVYNLNPKFLPDFDLIKQGKYSKTSYNFKELFPKRIRPNPDRPKMEESLQHRIFKRSSLLRAVLEERIGFELVEDVEVWEGFDIKRETLKL